MKKLAYIALLTLSPLAAHAACNVRALTSSELTGTQITGQIIYGEACRGVTTRAAYTADYYSFQGKTGDTISGGCTYSGYSNTYCVLIDPAGEQIANNNSNSLYDFTIKLVSNGLYKLIVTGNKYDVDNTSRETIDYGFTLKSSSPTQTIPPTTCPSDTYKNGKLTINSVEVADGLGGTLKYKVALSLKPLTNPLTFTLDKAEPLQ